MTSNVAINNKCDCDILPVLFERIVCDQTGCWGLRGMGVLRKKRVPYNPVGNKHTYLDDIEPKPLLVQVYK